MSERVAERNSFVERANRVRGRVPFAYWLAYDVVLTPLLVYGFVSLSRWFAVGLGMLAFAAFFDVNEAFVKWQRRRWLG